MEKINIQLTEEQVKLLLALIDVHTAETEPDFFLIEEGKVYTPMLDPEYHGYRVTVQEHLDRFLDKSKLDIC